MPRQDPQVILSDMVRMDYGDNSISHLLDLIYQQHMLSKKTYRELFGSRKDDRIKYLLTITVKEGGRLITVTDLDTNEVYEYP